ncbi:uncharacterized protein LOC132046486 [Lycium ferocissimum]|uniref:uncharacterized protein LOC132046486 n=1 Tax=Lycium ferocissimum TaxID=112874 RepID=UPI0028154B7F|nr:uncharacterized protein LOC132046486 [Lycium ferocissimum]XP_059293109.1 uncharacterized protein LOC132046486 [Lycium ferocissimum]XP_059293111.1 uncharacterized protein LOC132046486 [Lycium ferocissimum]XP_059293112.1 uncharacterized protein LOC132046486 [Lycium ferocissimum]
METAVPVPVSWIPEDDLLLKNAVEAGASLEALAKGAVRFSRRFTLQELKDRWDSLLYDSDVAALASARMVELEHSGINPVSKFNKSENLKGSKDVVRKRKVDSIRRQYYTMRKKFRSEFFNSTDIGFLDEPNLHDCNGHGTDFRQHVRIDAQARDGNCISDDLGLQESDLDILRNAFPEALADMPVTSAMADSHIAYNNRCSISVDDNSSDAILRDRRFAEDLSNSLREEGRNFFQPDMEDREIPDVFKDNSIDYESCSAVKRPRLSQLSPERKIFSIPEGKQLSTFHSRSDNRQNICSGPCGFRSGQHSHSPKSGAMLGARTGSTDFIDSSATSDGEFMDLPDSLLNLSNEDDILLEVDAKDSADNLCKANLKLLPDSPSDIPEGVSDDHESEVVKESNTNITVPDDLHPLGSEAENSSLHGQGVRSNCEVNVPSTSASSTDIKQPVDGSMLCTLNTEDTEIPCNDDIFLLIHPSTSFASTATQPVGQSSMDLSSACNKSEQRVSSFTREKDSGKSFAWTNKVGPNILGETRPVQPAAGSTAHLKVSGTIVLPVLPGAANKGVGVAGQSKSLPVNPEVYKNDVREENIARVRGVGDTPATFIEAQQCGESTSVRVAITEPTINPSTSEVEDPQSDDDVPYFSDVEAMILEMDLDPHDQDSYATRQESKYQSEDFRRTTIRLEQCVRSGLRRDMTPRGAFAILYGRHLRHYIRKTEVILGRSTDDVEVDIDLRKEGRANKISRRQASIKMESDGSFSLKNLGRCAIAVNGKSVDSGQYLTLSCSCVIEIREMSFVFEMNPKYVKQYIYSIAQNKGTHSKFEWSPERKP